MPAGRPPKPLEQKRLLGNPGKRRLPNGTSLVSLPPAPTEPDGEPDSGEELIARLLGGQAKAWIANTDRPLLALLRDAWDERTALRADVLGGPPEGDLKDQIAWLAATRKDLRTLEEQITKWLSLLGLSPTDRSRLGVAEVKAKSKLEELAAKRAERAGRLDTSPRSPKTPSKPVTAKTS